MTEEFDPKVYLQQGAWRDVRLGLHRTEELLERLGRPQDRLRIVRGRHERQGVDVRVHRGHSASGGLKVGLFTSPYVLRFNERIQVNREDISDEDLLAVALEVREAAERMDEQPTAFESLSRRRRCCTFAQVGCTAVVLEVAWAAGSTPRMSSCPRCAPLPRSLLTHACAGDTIAKIAQRKKPASSAGLAFPW